MTQTERKIELGLTGEIYLERQIAFGNTHITYVWMYIYMYMYMYMCTCMQNYNYSRSYCIIHCQEYRIQLYNNNNGNRKCMW